MFIKQLEITPPPMKPSEALLKGAEMLPLVRCQWWDTHQSPGGPLRLVGGCAITLMEVGALGVPKDLGSFTPEGGIYYRYLRSIREAGDHLHLVDRVINMVDNPEEGEDKEATISKIVVMLKRAGL